jgi:hypothetical protein
MMSKTNKAIRAAYPDKDIEAIAGAGYIYFDGNDGFDKIPSIMIHPRSVSAADRQRIILEHVAHNITAHKGE